MPCDESGPSREYRDRRRLNVKIGKGGQWQMQRLKPNEEDARIPCRAKKFARSDKSMTEVAHSGKDHRKTKAIGGGDNFGIAL